MQVAAIHLARKTQGGIEVFGEDPGAEAVGGIVGEGNGFVDVRRAGDANSRAKKLVAAHAHVRVHVGQQCRLDDRAFAFATA